MASATGQLASVATSDTENAASDAALKDFPKIIKAIVQATRSHGLVDLEQLSGLRTVDNSAIKDRYHLSNLTRHYLETWTLMKFPSRQDTLAVICACPELAQFVIRKEEKRFFAHLKDHQGLGHGTDAEESKALMLIQHDLLGKPGPNMLKATSHKEIARDLHQIYSILDPLLRCMAELFAAVQNARGFNITLVILRSIKARVWDNTDRELAQLDNIGPTRLGKLQQAGITRLAQLQNKKAYEIERILHVNPPFGQNIVQQLSNIPELRCDILMCKLPLEGLRSLSPDELRDASSPTRHSAIRHYRSSKDEHTWCVKINLKYLNTYSNPDQIPTWKGKVPRVTFSLSGQDGTLHSCWTGSLKRLKGGKDFWAPVKARHGYKLEAILSCESIVGAKDMVEWKI